MTAARVWLVAGLTGTAAPPPHVVGVTAVRDHQMRIWHAAGDGWWLTADGRHRATWGELHNRFDLVEVTSDVAQPAA